MQKKYIERKIRRKVDIAVCIDLGHRVKSSMTVI